jgi:hypothetical protein
MRTNATILCMMSLASLPGCPFDESQALPLGTETQSALTTSGESSTSSSSSASGTSIDPDGGSASTASTSSATTGTTSTTDDTGTTTGGRRSCNDGPTPANELAFGPPVPLPGVNTRSSEGAAWLSPDELEAWFNAARPGGAGGWDVYRATRDDPAAAFGPAALVAAVSTSANEEALSLTADALTLYSSTDGVASMGGYDITVTTRASTLVEFGALAPVANVNSSAHDTGTYVTADGSELYFATTRDGTWDIYRAELGVGGSFEVPTVVGSVSTPANNELAPVVSADGLTIYFASGPVHPELDIFVATRSSRDDGFGSAVNVGDVNSEDADVPVWLSSDGCRLLFASTRPGGLGGQDLWIAEREP